MAVSPNAAIAPYVASAVATPRPDASPTARPSASVRRMQSRLIGPTAAAMANPRRKPRAKSAGSIVRIMRPWTEPDAAAPAVPAGRPGTETPRRAGGAGGGRPRRLPRPGDPPRGRRRGRQRAVPRRSSTTGGPILADGAMGTMLFSAGLQFGDPPELWNLAHPDVVRRIHRGYLEAGSRIIMTNTFGGNRLRLGMHGNQERVDELNRTAAILLRAEVNAAGGTALVAGRHRAQRRDRRPARHARVRRGGRRLPRAGRVARRRRRRPHLDRDDVRPQRDQGRHRGRAAGGARASRSSPR